MISLVLSSILWSTSAVSNPSEAHPSYRGSSGSLHSISALPSQESTFGSAAIGHFFTSNPFIDDEKHSRNALRLSGNYWWSNNLELYGGFRFVFNEHSNADSSRSSTSFLDSTDLGAKWVVPVFGDISYAGIAGNAKFLSGTQSLRNTSGFSRESSGPLASAEIFLLKSFDLRDRWKQAPLRVHLNLGYRSPNSDFNPSSTLISDRSQQIEQFNLQAFKYHALLAQFAVEATYKWVSPYLEYRGEMALFADEGTSFENNRHKIGLGSRVTPHPAFAILGGVEFGIAGSNASTRVGIPENQDWEIFFGISFEALGKNLFEQEAGIRGRVLHAETGNPLPDVEVRIAGEPGLPQLTNLSGFYEVEGLKDGNYQVRFQKPNFETQTQNIEIENGEYAFLDIVMDTLGPKNGSFEATLTDATSGQPIPKAFVEITGMDRPLASNDRGKISADNVREGMQTLKVEAPGYKAAEFEIEIFPRETLKQSFKLEREKVKEGVCFGHVSNAEGTGLTAVFTSKDGSIQPFGTDPLTGDFRETLRAGSYTFKVQAENYLPKEAVCEVAPGAEFELKVQLEKPEEATIVEDKIILPEAIFFGFDAKEIEKRSYEVLDQISEILIKNEDRFKHLRIEGHTDSVGSEVYNLELSRKRAESVRIYLIEAGVNADQLKALGFGESDPVATNLTEEGRAENRRVEFNLVRETEE